jgi:osmotically-inducible protein OsmY
VRKLKSIGAAMAGAAVAYFMDPDSGAARRARTKSQSAARWRDLLADMKARIEYQKGVARGLKHDVASTFREDREFDDDQLVQKVRSEALGPWIQRTGHTGDVDVTVEDGEVTVEGSIDEPDRRHGLLELIENVEGVLTVTDRLTPPENRAPN